MATPDVAGTGAVITVVVGDVVVGATTEIVVMVAGASIAAEAAVIDGVGNVLAGWTLLFVDFSPVSQ